MDQNTSSGPELADEFGGCIESPSQIIGEEFQGRHAIGRLSRAKGSCV